MVKWYIDPANYTSVVKSFFLFFFLPLFGSVGRIASNFEQIELSQEDYDALTAFGKKNPIRFNIPYVVNKPKWGINVFGGDNEQTAEHRVKIV
jgi:L-glyceraldehyde reductase